MNTPVNSKKLENVPNGKVIISQNVFEELLTVNDESENEKKEFAFFLTGEVDGQIVRFDNIRWCRNTGNSGEADFTPLISLIDEFVRVVQARGVENQIVCNGHTHPKSMSAFSEDFSLYDMAGFMHMKEENEVFKSGTIELCAGILSDLNFNFCFYDRNMQRFYKFNDVVLELENESEIPLSCYDRKINRQYIADRIVEDDFQL